MNSSPTELLSSQLRAACPNSTAGTFPEQQTTSSILLPPSPSAEPALTDYQMRLGVFHKHQSTKDAPEMGQSHEQLQGPELLQPFQSSPVQVRISCCFEAEVSSEVCSLILKETCSTKSSNTYSREKLITCNTSPHSPACLSCHFLVELRQPAQRLVLKVEFAVGKEPSLPAPPLQPDHSQPCQVRPAVTYIQQPPHKLQA